jgi:ferredoxin-NADP reductase
MKNIVRILDIKQVTHDVKCFRTEKPIRYVFSPGQATDVASNKPGMEDEKRPFSFTSLNKEPYIEFTIKCYTSHHGVTDKLHQLVPGDELIMEDVWGNLEKTVEHALDFSSKLSTLCDSSDYTSKQKLQFLLFPEGIYYDKKN